MIRTGAVAGATRPLCTAPLFESCHIIATATVAAGALGVVVRKDGLRAHTNRACLSTGERVGAPGGALHIPLLLLSARGSKEQQRILAGKPTEIEAQRMREKAADEADTRPAKEVIQELRDEGRLPATTPRSTALPTAAWPVSNLPPKPPQKTTRGPRRHQSRESSGRYSLSAAETV